MLTFTLTPGPPTTESPSSGNSAFISAEEDCGYVWNLHTNQGPKGFLHGAPTK